MVGSLNDDSERIFVLLKDSDAAYILGRPVRSVSQLYSLMVG